MLNLPQSNGLCFVGCNEPSVFQNIKNIVENSCTVFFKAIFDVFNWIILKKTYEAIIALLVITIMILVKKGRHVKEKTIASSESNVSNPSAATTTTNFNLVHTVHCNQEQPDNQLFNRAGDKDMNYIKMPLLTENYSLQNWLAILEHNLMFKNKTEWVNFALDHMDDKISSQVSNLKKFLNNQFGYENLKQE